MCTLWYTRLPLSFRIVTQETGSSGVGAEVPWDGETRGELQVSGPWIAATYYNDDRAGDSFTEDGWLRTGDVATVTADTRSAVTPNERRASAKASKAARHVG